ncbi:MAG: hypothetical protein WEA58_08835 [Balneolaceae bacterium]
MNKKRNMTLILLIVAGFLAAGFVVESNKMASKTDYDIDKPKNIEWYSTSVQGELSGFDCAVVGEYCPTTHRGADYTTGVFNKQDKEFYFVVNIPQSFLQQYFRETVEVEGTVYDPYSRAIEPETIHLIDGDERTLVYEEGYFIDENERRATFQNGVLQDGRWTVQ